MILNVGGNLVKIKNDKYYTPIELAEYCINKTYEVVGLENISEVIEPSAGCGNFSNLIKDCIAYDIEPESDNIIKQDFLQIETGYKKGRLIIGNPPYGEKLNLAQQFYRKAVDMGDYISFILPIGQFNNTNSLYQFDLIYSEDLGKHTYTDRNLHCCLNVYKRPAKGINKQKKIKLQDITIVRQDSKKYNEVLNYDIRMCYWGDGTAGKILKENDKYAAEYKIIINNKLLKDKIIDCLNNVNWHEELNKIAMLKIQQFHIHNILKKYIPEIN